MQHNKIENNSVTYKEYFNTKKHHNKTQKSLLSTKQHDGITNEHYKT